MFDLSEKEQQDLDIWLVKHKKRCKEKNRHLTYMFTPTGIGNIIVIRCSCGKEIDVTDSSCW